MFLFWKRPHSGFLQIFWSHLCCSYQPLTRSLEMTNWNNEEALSPLVIPVNDSGSPASRRSLFALCIGGNSLLLWTCIFGRLYRVLWQLASVQTRRNKHQCPKLAGDKSSRQLDGKKNKSNILSKFFQDTPFLKSFRLFHSVSKKMPEVGLESGHIRTFQAALKSNTLEIWICAWAKCQALSRSALLPTAAGPATCQVHLMTFQRTNMCESNGAERSPGSCSSNPKVSVLSSSGRRKRPQDEQQVGWNDELPLIFWHSVGGESRDAELGQNGQ